MTMIKEAKTKQQPVDLDLKRLTAKYRSEPGGLIPLLQEVQSRQGYLSREVLEQIAGQMHLSLAKIMGVASFYSQFSLKPRGKNIIRVCTGTACHVRGGSGIFDSLKENLGVEKGGTTKDLEFTLETVACVGACSLAPVMMVNEDTHGRLNSDQLGCMLEQYRTK